MHTLEHFRKNIWTPALFDRRCTTTLKDEKARDMLAVARDKVHEIWARRDLYRIDEDKTRDIEKIVERAGNSLR
jgi:trimethylamine:corrinoid methyltransferase-like protein